MNGTQLCGEALTVAATCLSLGWARAGKSEGRCLPCPLQARGPGACCLGLGSLHRARAAQPGSCAMLPRTLTSAAAPPRQSAMLLHKASCTSQQLASRALCVLFTRMSNRWAPA